MTTGEELVPCGHAAEGTSQVPGGMEQNDAEFLCAPQSIAPCDTYTLLIPGTFHLIVSG